MPQSYLSELIAILVIPVSYTCLTRIQACCLLGIMFLILPLYRMLAWLQHYLTFTRPDISYAVQQVCLFMHDPREPHFSALKRILRYVRGTLTSGLQLYSSTTSSLVAYSDADWAGCPTTRRSTSGYCVFLGNNLLSWSINWRELLAPNLLISPLLIRITSHV
ncbi:ribonuclease H-like domain-containing protein [Tanacetum coccineum]